jgi:alanyl-tRNA synthetase
MSLEEAKRSGALAFFGDKYDQKVRVVGVGDFSKELCGGTHLDDISKIGLFKIMREGSVASGIRRIEACTSAAAEEWLKEQQKLDREKEKAIEKKEKAKERARQGLKKVEEEAAVIIEKAQDISGIKLIINKKEALTADGLRRISDIARTRLKTFVLFLVSSTEGKLNLLLSVSDDMVKKGLHAGRLISQVAALIGGSGGGKPDMALGGAKDIEKIDYLIEQAKSILIKEIKG